MTTQMPNPALKAPGETNPEFARAVVEYLSKFEYHYVIHSDWAYKNNVKEVYQWCTDNLGQQYKDWHLVGGGAKNTHSVIHIRSGKRATLFALRWTNMIDHSYNM